MTNHGGGFAVFRVVVVPGITSAITVTAGATTRVSPKPTARMVALVTMEKVILGTRETEKECR